MKARILVIIAHLLASTAAFGGNEGGGGGGAVYCPSTKTWETTDLHEARVRHPELLATQNRLRETLKTPEQAAEYLFQVTQDYLGPISSQDTMAEAKKELLSIYYSVRVVPELKDPKDSGFVLIAPGCLSEKRVLVNHYRYDNESHKTFAEELSLEASPEWLSLSIYDQFALLAHDMYHGTQQGRITISTMDPLLPKQTSAFVRRLNGNLMSGYVPVRRADLFSNSTMTVNCTAFTQWGARPRQSGVGLDSVYFDLVKTSQGNWRMVFEEVLNYRTLLPTYVDLDSQVNFTFGKDTPELIINESIPTPLTIFENTAPVDGQKPDLKATDIKVALQKMALNAGELSPITGAKNERLTTAISLYLGEERIFLGHSHCVRPK